MAAPKGNKFSVQFANPDRPPGRPIERNREQLAAELIEWSNLPDSINFNAFCCSRTPPLSPMKMMEYSNSNYEFRVAYEIAKAAVAARREMKLAKQEIHPKAFDLNATVYDQFAKNEKRGDLEYEYALKLKEAKTVSESQTAQFDAMMKMMNEYQKAKIDSAPK